MLYKHFHSFRFPFCFDLCIFLCKIIECQKNWEIIPLVQQFRRLPTGVVQFCQMHWIGLFGRICKFSYFAFVPKSSEAPIKITIIINLITFLISSTSSFQIHWKPHQHQAPQAHILWLLPHYSQTLPKLTN